MGWENIKIFLAFKFFTAETAEIFLNKGQGQKGILNIS